MANNKRFFKTISLAHWHVKLSIAAQLPMVLSFRWEQTCELVINVEHTEWLISQCDGKIIQIERSGL